MRINLSSFLQWRINIFLIQKLGWTFTFVYLYLLGKLYFLLKRKEKHKIITSIYTVFAEHKDRREIKSLTRAVFRGIFSHYFEKIFNAYSPVEMLKTFFNTHMESEGMDALDKVLAKGKGVLLVTGHFGGVEFIPLFLGFKNYPVTMVVKFSTDHLRTISLQQAAQFSIDIIDPDKTPNVMKAILSCLKRNRIVITQCDEIDEWRLSRKDKLFFLGKQTYLDKTINVLSKRASVPVVFEIMHRNNEHRYKFIATSWDEMAQKFQRSPNMSPGSVLLKFLEKYIYVYPEEWYQWKKYPAIETVPVTVVPAPVMPTAAPVPVQFMEPSLGKAA